MASTTRGSTSRPERRRALAAALVLAGAAWLPAARADGPEVTQLRLERADEGVLLTAAVRFDLPAAIEDALLKGIPMFFVAEAVLLRERWWWTDRQVAQAQRHWRLSYQPLTRRWRLQVSPTPIGNSGLALGQNFDSSEEALRAVQTIARWKIAELGDLEPDARYSVDFRFRLDVSQLPRPFQIGAVGQSGWSIVAARTQRVALEGTR
jgi:hypothetical protein